ncbi:MAG TPA: nitroreductase family deazaflavin-dependent oxidoreductase [Actinomycetota bacterium]|nr:nitroreductase family deazaflavin-dependent oxidoreductase [Actinomycetota bacterium]
MATNPNDWNASIIKEFRANAGKVGGFFEGKPVLLLHHTGAKSGTERVNPLMYRTDGDRYVVFASKGGAPTNPDWFYNLKANPAAKVEVGTDAVDVTARVAEREERDALYAKQAEEYPQFGEYAKQTSRTIPVIVLEPAS